MKPPLPPENPSNRGRPPNALVAWVEKSFWRFALVAVTPTALVALVEWLR